jgi:hypothetical protein
VPEPIVHELSLRCDREHAFEVYAGRIGEWWDPGYTANAATLEAVTIESRVGGRVFATHSDVGRDDWGEVTVWEPGRRLVHTFTLAQAAQHPSEVSVELGPDDEGCAVNFQHGGWNGANAALRSKFGDWPYLLGRFTALAES